MPQQIPPPPKRGLSTRTIAGPLTALTLAGLLYVYSRSAIQAAKRNAKEHREADGGQIDWENENLRRHGMMARPGEKKGSVRELVDEIRKQAAGDVLDDKDKKN